MTIDELLEWARDAATADDTQHLRDRAATVVRLLGVGFPCGWPMPEVVHYPPGPPLVRLEGLGSLLPDEARGIAVQLFRCADEADAAKEGK